jgi:hypothetical protein
METQQAVAMWCNECKSIRGPGGEPLDYCGRPTQWWRPRCGVDYGPELHSHFDVVPLYATQRTEADR